MDEIVVFEVVGGLRVAVGVFDVGIVVRRDDSQVSVNKTGD